MRFRPDRGRLPRPAQGYHTAWNGGGHRIATDTYPVEVTMILSAIGTAFIILVIVLVLAVIGLISLLRGRV